MKAIATNLCNNILLRGKKDDVAISPMKLQKLMYYVCRDYVKETGEMPIDEWFEVWQYGPVLSSVYNEFKVFGAKPITSFAKDATGKSYSVNEDANPVLSGIIDVVWAKYKRLSGIDLSKKTHKQESGWYRAYMDHRSQITLEDMQHDNS